jgi:protein YibB
MNDITIVTAFFDIGRGEWTPDKGLPHYLQRTNDTYFERFSHMAKLENEMVVYTAPEFESRVKELRGDRKTEIVVIDFKYNYDELRKRISQVQQNPEYQSKISENQRSNPEYWNPDYVLVNSLKSTFAMQAIENGFATNELVAWMDFGYCRTADALNGKTRWQYNFDKYKIHLFNLREYDGRPLINIIANNIVYMTGPCIVSGRTGWNNLYSMMNHNLNNLLKSGLIDDDQTLLLMSYLSLPEVFELHPVKEDDWFVAFKDYNESIS